MVEASPRMKLKRDWRLIDLLPLFPELGEVQARGSFALREPAEGQGRYVKDTGGRRQAAGVRLRGSPLSELLISLPHEDQTREDADTFRRERALLLGVVEAIARSTNPAWRCHMQAAIERDENASSMAIQLAAAMAVEDLCRKGLWTPQPPEVA